MAERTPQQNRSDATNDVAEALDALRMTTRGLDGHMNYNDSTMREYVAALQCVEAKLSRANDYLQEAIAGDLEAFISKNYSGERKDGGGDE